eukprot:CAMPEP_0174820060 /NCGR_PEP_ID=MMETSP1107-20130205/3624_1 /TAXON_ID=36770 /ORGANISM="Paraphysomonas vestita, Strain GFlagA" /LENGTH=254 /DNA_ID=CAMNT_0016034641 /DNA_START=59 /DNA_END=823 /DNA_ORIENTATION=-
MVTTWYTWWHTSLSGRNTDDTTPSTILKNIEDHFESVIIEHCPHALEGFDKEGHPVYWEQTGFISNNLNQIAAVMTLDDLLNRHIRLQELMHIRREYKSKQLGKSIEKSVIILDLKHLSMSPSFFGIQYVQKMFQIDEKYYPERLAKLFIINTPWFFSAIYALITPFIDPITASKIRIIGSDYLDELREHIDDSEIPVEMGGSKSGITWQWPYPEESGISPEQIRLYQEEHQSNKSSKVFASDESRDNIAYEAG